MTPLTATAIASRALPEHKPVGSVELSRVAWRGIFRVILLASLLAIGFAFRALAHDAFSIELGSNDAKTKATSVRGTIVRNGDAG